MILQFGLSIAMAQVAYTAWYFKEIRNDINIIFPKTQFWYNQRSMGGNIKVYFNLPCQNQIFSELSKKLLFMKNRFFNLE